MTSILQQTFTSALHTSTRSITMDTDNPAVASEFNSTTPQPDRIEIGFYSPFNNPWNVISAATKETVIGFLDYMYILFVVIGLPANTINCLVFYRQGLRDRMNLCLCWLAATDLCYLLCVTATRTTATCIELIDPVFSKTYDAFSKLYLSGPLFSFLTTSSCVTMVIAVERSLCVLFPLKAQTLMSTRTMAVLLLTITLLLQLGFSLFRFKYTIGRIVDIQTGRSVWSLVPARGPNQDLISKIFDVVFNITLLFAMNLVALSVVVICTVITVIKLKQAMAWRMSTDGSSSSDSLSRQNALTKMLVAVCCVYVVCSTPGCIMALVRRVEPGYKPTGRYSNIFALSHVIGYRVFSATNSSVNFFVFCCMSSKFRQELRHLCLRGATIGMKGQTEVTKSTE